MPRPFRTLALGLSVTVSAVAAGAPQADPHIARIIEIGKSDPQAMALLDVLTNRFGGRYTGSDAYTAASDWAVWQFGRWGLRAWKEDVGAMPVGFNRGPWFGKMTKPREMALFFATPSMTAGTRGAQTGHVVPAPENVEDAERAKDRIKGAWLLWPGKSEGFARDGRKKTEMAPLVRACAAAGALGTVQAAPEPLQAMDGSVTSWDDLPVLPDIKLAERQYDEIKALVEKGEGVELQFDVRNHFRMGPVPYCNVIAVLEGRERPDEYVVLGGHLDSFDSATGACDDGNGAASAMEAARLLAAAGVRPRRSIMVVLFAAEEMGLWGSLDIVKKHPEWNDGISLVWVRDGSPHAATGASVPPGWYEDFERFTAPLKDIDPRFPFLLQKSEFPSVRPEAPGGTDAVPYMMAGVPTLLGAGSSPMNDYDYRRTWHTVYDTYDAIVPYSDHQQHAAICQAVIAYGVAELPHLLSRDGLYLGDGLYADINFGTRESPRRAMVRLDMDGAPSHVAHFLSSVEGRAEPQRGRPAAAGGEPPLAVVASAGGGVLEARLTRQAEVTRFPRAASKRSRPEKGLLGYAPDGFAIALGQAPMPRKYAPIGAILAATDGLDGLEPQEPLKSLRIYRVGERAKAFGGAVKKDKARAGAPGGQKWTRGQK
jgi:hypothetical protein